MNLSASNPPMHLRRHILRGGGLLALGGVASLLGWRSLRQPCAATHPCGSCPWLADCTLPKALDARAQKSTAPPGNTPIR